MHVAMSELHERAFVECPYHRARTYLAMGIGRRSAGSSHTMELRVPLIAGELKKDVAVTFAPGIDPMHIDQPWSVHWVPEGGGPYPDFDGELTVRAADDYTACVLELRGEYKPPGGMLGEAFDRVVGGRIATLTARTLLLTIGSEFESRYRAEEEEKR